MSLSTLLEAAKYLDLLDASKQQQQQNGGQPQTLTRRKSLRRPRSVKKNAVMAMSLPSSSGLTGRRGKVTQSVPIPVMSGAHHQVANSLSSSLTTTGSPSSSSASTALLCQKASHMMSISSSSAASSLSSSDSSSSCGEILMGENYFDNNSFSARRKKHSISDTNGQVYHITHQQQLFDAATNNNNHQQVGDNTMQSSPVTQFAIHDISKNSGKRTVSRYIAAAPNGHQYLAMRTESSSAIPIDASKMRAGHVIRAVSNEAHYSLSGDNHQATTTLKGPDGQTFLASGTFTLGDNLAVGSPSSGGTGGPLIMARVQPMILNSLAHPKTQNIIAFQQAASSSPTSSSSSYSRHRELHKTLEKNRRAHLRHCFELLKSELPASECFDKKTSHINIIKTAIRYVLSLQQQEAGIDMELQRLTRVKNDLTVGLSKLNLGSQKKSPDSSLPANSGGASFSSKHESLTVQSMKVDPSETKSSTISNSNNEDNISKQVMQLPAAEQQLSFLLSKSKID